MGRERGPARREHLGGLPLAAESPPIPYFGDCPSNGSPSTRWSGTSPRSSPRATPFPRSINMTVTLLGAILEGAVERELIPATPRGEGPPGQVNARPQRSYLDTAGQIAALLEAAGELDRAHEGAARRAPGDARRARVRRPADRRAVRAALARRRPRRRMAHVGDSKTDAGLRKVKIRGALRDNCLRPAGATRTRRRTPTCSRPRRADE